MDLLWWLQVVADQVSISTNDTKGLLTSGSAYLDSVTSRSTTDVNDSCCGSLGATMSGESE